jgi:hypothetical protein
MTIEEWKNKTDEWKNGYMAYVNCYVIENQDEKSKDWWLGFDYACRYAKSAQQNGEYPFVFFAKKR